MHYLNFSLIQTLFHMNFFLLVSERVAVSVHHGERAHKSQPLYCPNANSGALHFSPRRRSRDTVLTLQLLNQTFKDQGEIWRFWCRPLSETGGCREAPSSCEDSRRVGSVLQVLVSCSALGSIRWLSSYCWSPGRPASLISRHLVETFIALDFLNILFILLLWFLLFLNCVFLLNYRGFELE